MRNFSKFTMVSFGSDPLSCGGLLYAVYYQQDRISILGDTSFPYCAFHGVGETELIQFAGKIGIELCRLSESWTPISDTVKVTGWASGAVLLIGSFSFLVYKLYSCLTPRSFESLTSVSSPTSTPSPRRRLPNKRQLNRGTNSVEGEQGERLVAVIDLSDESDDDESLQAEYFGPSLPPTPSSEDEPLSPLLERSTSGFYGSAHMPRCFSTPAGFLGERSDGDGISSSQLGQFDEDLWSDDRASSTEFWSVKPDDGAIQMRTSPDGTERSRSRSQSLCENQPLAKRVLRRQHAIAASDVSSLYRVGSSESLLSDLDSMVGSIEFNLKDPVGSQTLKYLDRLEAEVNNLRENCMVIDQEIEHLADDESDEAPKQRIPSNVSSWSLSSFSSDMSDRFEKGGKFKGHLAMTMVGASLLLDSDSPDSSLMTTSPVNESLEWDSPVHGWSTVPANKYFEPLPSETTPSTAKSDANGEDTETPWEWDNDGLGVELQVTEEEMDATLVPAQVSIEIDNVESEGDSRSRSSTKSPSPVTVRSVSRSKSPCDRSDRRSTLTLPGTSPRLRYLAPLSRAGSQPNVSCQPLVRSPKKWVSVGDSVEISDESEQGSGVALSPLSEYKNECEHEFKTTLSKTCTYESLMSTAETPGSFCPSIPRSLGSQANHLYEGDRDSAYDGGFDMMADIGQETVGSKVDTMAYAEAVWQGQTDRAKTTKKGFAEAVLRTGCTRMRRFRGDSYSLLRATVYAALNMRHKLPPASETLRVLKETLHKRGQAWLLDWSFANRLPYGRENVEEGWRECLNCLENLAIDLNHESDIGGALAHSLSVDCELDIRLVEAAKLHILASMLEPFSLDPNGNYDTTRAYIQKNLDTVGDTAHLTEKDLHSVARALRLNLCLLKPSAYGTDRFSTLACAGSEDSLVTLIAEDDRYYCVPVL